MYKASYFNACGKFSLFTAYIVDEYPLQNLCMSCGLVSLKASFILFDSHA